MIKVVYPAPNGAEHAFITKELEHVPLKSMKHYLHDLHAVALRQRCRMVVEGKGETLRLSYVPNDGETIKLLKKGQSVA
jgi:hypothetical protein